MILKINAAALAVALLGCLLAAPAHGQGAGEGRDAYLNAAKEAYEQGIVDTRERVAEWREEFVPSPFWGYGPPGEPIWLARLAAALYEHTGEERYAREALPWLLEHHTYKRLFPEEMRKARPEYANGLPTMTDFFQLPVYCRTWLAIRDCAFVTDEDHTIVARSVAESADFQLSHPEWGPHNRAILRAEGLELAAQVVPDHPEAPTWRRLARILAADSFGQWEEEDAQIYHPVWISSQIRYADAIGDGSLFDEPTFRYYFDYFLHLLAPSGMIPEFGDARWNENWALYIACFARGTAEYGRMEYSWAARRIFEAMIPRESQVISVRSAVRLMDAYAWAGEAPGKISPPIARSEEVLEDLVGKKVVFRDGWGGDATYMLLNYRDEGDYARVPRDYLRHTIPVEEEKMHHGHSDENSICLLMDGGSVLLNESGYRDAIPSGEYGRFREDYFHNRLVTRRHKQGRTQPLFEFLRSSGAYESVRTEKIDFFTSGEVDVSRTRLVDERTGVQSDRAIAWVKDLGVFVIVDVVKFLEADYYTLATLWHTTTILEGGEHHFVTAIDSLWNDEPRGDRALLIDFLSSGSRDRGTFPIVRQHQEEIAVHEAVASHYPAGRIETFVTVLVPHARGADVAPLVAGIRALEVDDSRAGVGVELSFGGDTRTLCFQTNLDRGVLTENVRPRYTFASGAVSYGSFRTDASFLYARRSGSELTWCATHMVGVEHDGESLFLARENSFTLQPDDLSTRIGRTKWRYWEDTFRIE